MKKTYLSLALLALFLAPGWVLSQCVSISSVTQSGIPGGGTIDLTGGGTATISTCVTFTYSQAGSNWIHGVFMSPSATGFSSSTGTTVSISSCDPIGPGQYYWVNTTNDFTSNNSGQTITANGWFAGTSTTDANQGDNLGMSCITSSTAITMCFSTVLACGTLTGSNGGTLNFGFTSDSYSGSWTDNACGQEFSSGSNSFSYTLSCPVTLPVELLSFNAGCSEDAVIINWETASESNSDYFTVEKSTDGSNFYFVAKMNAAGNSSTVKKYSATDTEPHSASYYRLSQTDFNGATKVFPPVAVRSCGNGNISAFSNGNNVTLMINSKEDNNYNIVLADAQGRIILDKKEFFAAGNNKTTFPVNADNGIYILKVYNGTDMHVQKVSIQK